LQFDDGRPPQVYSRTPTMSPKFLQLYTCRMYGEEVPVMGLIPWPQNPTCFSFRIL
jgi:hypothetical protein